MSNDECRNRTAVLSELLWASSFYFIPNFFQLFQVRVAQFLPLTPKLVLDPIKSCHEFFRRGLERFLRIKPTLSREIYDSEQQVPDLIRDLGGIAAGDRVFRLAQFFIHLRDDIRQLRPIEIDASRFLLRFLGAHQGRQRWKPGEIVPIAAAALFLMLDRFPLFQDRKSTRLNSSHVSESRMP